MHWKAMGRTVSWAVLLAASMNPPAKADVIVTMSPVDSAGNAAATTVGAGTGRTVEILLSVTADDSPLRDIRLIQFDFSATTDTIALSNFEWLLDPGVSDASYLQRENLPITSAVYIHTEREEGFIIDLTATPARVARILVTVNDAGTLDAVNAQADGADRGASVIAGFVPESFSATSGNLVGGTVAFEIESSQDAGGGGTGGGTGSAGTGDGAGTEAGTDAGSSDGSATGEGPDGASPSAPDSGTGSDDPTSGGGTGSGTGSVDEGGDEPTGSEPDSGGSSSPGSGGTGESGSEGGGDDSADAGSGSSSSSTSGTVPAGRLCGIGIMAAWGLSLLGLTGIRIRRLFRSEP